LVPSVTNTDYVALDRSSLLSRIGPETPDLTTIMQIARVPTDRDNTVSSETLIAQIMQRLECGGDNIDRSAIDEFLFEMMRMTEDHGLQSAPRWPAIAMTPLAIYRPMPLAPALDPDDEPAESHLS
jgi:hypothetical protein